MISDRRYARKRSLSCNTLLLVSTVLIPLLGFVGCEDSKKDSRFDLSGKITYGGNPIPKGYLRFAPDKEKGNSGPGSSASIINGQFKTMTGQGTVGGPHVVSIVGTDGVPIELGEGIPPNLAGKAIFPAYEISIDLPRQAGTYDIDVPASHKLDDSAEADERETDSADNE